MLTAVDGTLPADIGALTVIRKIKTCCAVRVRHCCGVTASGYRTGCGMVCIIARNFGVVVIMIRICGIFHIEIFIRIRYLTGGNGTSGLVLCGIIVFGKTCCT